MQFVAVKIEDVVGLRLEIGQRVLLHGFESRGELFEAIGGFGRAIGGGFGAFGLALEQFARGLRLAIGFFGMFGRGRAQIREVVVGFLVKGRQQGVGALGHCRCGDFLSRSEPGVNGSLPAMLRGFDFAAEIAAPLFECGGERGFGLLLRFVRGGREIVAIRAE